MSEPRASRPLPAGEDLLGKILGHHAWATLRLIDRCLELTPEQLELSTPGTYGSIHATLAHLVRGDGGLLQAAAGEEFGFVPQGSPPSVAALRADMERQARQWRGLLGRKDELSATMPAEDDPAYGLERRCATPSGIEHTEGHFLAQAIHHGAEHRTHVCSILGAHSLEVPDLSGWAYFASCGSAMDDPDGNEVEVVAPP